MFGVKIRTQRMPHHNHESRPSAAVVVAAAQGHRRRPPPREKMAALATAWGGPSLYDEAADMEVRQGRTLKTLWTEVPQDQDGLDGRPADATHVLFVHGSCASMAQYFQVGRRMDRAEYCTPFATAWTHHPHHHHHHLHLTIAAMATIATIATIATMATMAKWAISPNHHNSRLKPPAPRIPIRPATPYHTMPYHTIPYTALPCRTIPCHAR